MAQYRPRGVLFRLFGNNENNPGEEDEEDEYKDIKLGDIDIKKLKDFIFEEFSNKLDNMDDINNIINLIDCIEGKIRNEKTDKEKDIEEKIEQESNDKEVIINEFLQKLLKKNLFTKEEFFSNNQNLKISLLYKLYERGKIQKNEEQYYENITNLLDSIRKELEGEIQKKELEKFLENDKAFIIQRLSLINIILEGFTIKFLFISEC